MISARLLRGPALDEISDERPGYYKWWADRESLDIVLNKLEVSFEEIEPYVETREDLFCIYVGIAVKESLRKRLDWHVNQRHTASAVRNGTLSTLRQTISSLVAHDQSAEEATNEFIDRLKVEYHESSFGIKSSEASDELHRIEREALSSHLCILNIQENNHPQVFEIKRKLKQLRKESKIAR